MDLTGVDPEATAWRGLHELQVQQVNDEIKESLQLSDPSHLTTLLLLDYHATAYLNDRCFSVVELLSNQSEIAAYLTKARELYTILRSPEMQSQVAEFKGWLRAALHHYGVENEAVYQMAESEDALALLRRDALRSLERLEVHQFSQGQPAPQGKVQYVRKVHGWWNINSLLRAMWSDATLSGISLNVIRDPLETSSYFAFAVRNGETLSILTDRPSEAHPLQKYLARRPDRDLARRIARHHFPYGLLDVAYNDKGGAYISPRDTQEVAVYQPELYPLRNLRDLEPDEVIWIVMVFALIEERFWRQGYRTPELSYTGEMMVRRAALVDETALAIPARARRTMEVARLTPADVTTDALLGDWAYAPTQENRWLEERYRHLVPEGLLNLAGDGARVPMLTDGNEVQSLTPQELAQIEKEVRVFGRRDVGRRLAALDGTSFGSRKRLVSDQRWVARYNQAVVVQREAEREFTARKDEVAQDYRGRIEANARRLLEAIARGERTEPVAGHVLLKVQALADWQQDAWKSSALSVPRQTWTGHRTCYVTGGRAAIVARFRPETAEDLAFLCGCGVDELPDVLQHWTREEAYSGNPNLQRLDPMDWIVQNPWREMTVDVDVFLSKSAYNGVRKALGLPPNKFWTE